MLVVLFLLALGLLRPVSALYLRISCPAMAVNRDGGISRLYRRAGNKKAIESSARTSGRSSGVPSSRL